MLKMCLYLDVYLELSGKDEEWWYYHYSDKSTGNLFLYFSLENPDRSLKSRRNKKGEWLDQENTYTLWLESKAGLAELFLLGIVGIIPCIRTDTTKNHSAVSMLDMFVCWGGHGSELSGSHMVKDTSKTRAGLTFSLHIYCAIKFPLFHYFLNVRWIVEPVVRAGHT